MIVVYRLTKVESYILLSQLKSTSNKFFFRLKKIRSSLAIKLKKLCYYLRHCQNFYIFICNHPHGVVGTKQISVINIFVFKTII